MGQATVDLPDPLSAAPVSSGNTDELLAQLAGEEIERLLAESDEPGESAHPSNTPSPTSATLIPNKASVGPAEAASSAGVSSLVEAPAAPAKDAQVDLAALFEKLEGSGPEQAPPAPAVAKAIAPSDEAPSVADALAQEMLEDAATSGIGGTAPGGHSGEVSATSKEHSRAAQPILVRVLEWINGPLEVFPDHVRDLIGKIAILTTVNAAAVLAYVLFFRH